MQFDIKHQTRQTALYVDEFEYYEELCKVVNSINQKRNRTIN